MSKREIITPLGDRVVVEREAVATQSKGGIIIPDAAKRDDFRAKVVAVGPGSTLESGARRQMTLKVGDLVVIGKHFGTDVLLDGRKLLVLGEGDVLGVVEC